MLVVAEDTASAQASLIEEWSQQVANEGWSVVKEVTPKTGWQSSQREARARRILERAEAVQPKALFLLGGVPRPASGNYAPDGHPARCIWNDFPYSGVIPATSYTDLQNHNIETGLVHYKNLAGDGRWDQTYLLGSARWAVGRVDFSEIPLISRGTIPAGFYAPGSERTPMVDEQAAVRNYLERNLAWRRGEWPLEAKGVIISSLWNDAQVATLRANIPEVEWTRTDLFTNSPFAGREIYSYASYGQDYRYHFYLSSPERMIRGFWFNNYRSYEFEPIREQNPNQQGDNGNRRWLQWFLAVTWGPLKGDWLTGRTIADGYLANFSQRRYYTPNLQLDGDPTLPIRSPNMLTKPRSPAGLRVLSN